MRPATKNMGYSKKIIHQIGDAENMKLYREVSFKHLLKTAEINDNTTKFFYDDSIIHLPNDMYREILEEVRNYVHKSPVGGQFMLSILTDKPEDLSKVYKARDFDLYYDNKPGTDTGNE